MSKITACNGVEILISGSLTLSYVTTFNRRKSFIFYYVPRNSNRMGDGQFKNFFYWLSILQYILTSIKSD